jgi:hypothetical protein
MIHLLYVQMQLTHSSNLVSLRLYIYNIIHYNVIQPNRELSYKFYDPDIVKPVFMLNLQNKLPCVIVGYTFSLTVH